MIQEVNGPYHSYHDGPGREMITIDYFAEKAILYPTTEDALIKSDRGTGPLKSPQPRLQRKREVRIPTPQCQVGAGADQERQAACVIHA